MRLKFLFIFCLYCFVSCKKTDNPPGIFPQPYFPAFAGSSWTYVNDDGALITYSTEPEYAVDEFEFEGERFSGKVPVYEGKYVWGYAFRSEAAGTSIFMDDEKPAGRALRESCHQGTCVRTYILAKDTTVQVAGVDHYPTIVIETQYSYPMDIPLSRYYYTRDIGLVKIEEFSGGEIDNTLSLVSYFINR